MSETTVPRRSWARRAETTDPVRLVHEEAALARNYQSLDRPSMADMPSSAVPVGETFNRFTVLADAGVVGRYRFWRCRCACGAIKNIRGSNVRNGRTQSCGCVKRAKIRERSLKHGMAARGARRTPEYRAWCAILQRCINPQNRAYPRYGGRGIRVCDKWLDFDAFLADMGPRPSAEYSIDRKDNNGPYDKDNCVWATREEQQRNRRVNVVLEFNGKRQTVVEWATEVGLLPSTLYSRLRLGWSAERALTTGVKRATV